jgi:GntR family transcriptional regulator
VYAWQRGQPLVAQRRKAVESRATACLTSREVQPGQEGLAQLAALVKMALRAPPYRRYPDVRTLPGSFDAYDAIMSSTTSFIRVDLSSPVPLHEQVAAAIRGAIAAGEAGPGDRLPPARDFAAVLGVNANTVLRAFRALRDEGLLEFRRGRGVTVTGTAPQRSAVVAKARELVEVARWHGLGLEELVQVIRQVA